ncbi:MAG: hypothetical protein ACREHG_10310, partial [Candidatus Saccharimonadales bacterium]
GTSSFGGIGKNHVSSDGNYLYVASWTTNGSLIYKINALDLSINNQSPTLDTSPDSYYLSSSGYLYVLGQSGSYQLVKINVSNMSVVKTSDFTGWDIASP